MHETSFVNTSSPWKIFRPRATAAHLVIPDGLNLERRADRHGVDRQGRHVADAQLVGDPVLVRVVILARLPEVRVLLAGLHPEVELARITDKIALVRGDAFPLEGPDDQVDAHALDLCPIDLEASRILAGVFVQLLDHVVQVWLRIAARVGHGELAEFRPLGFQRDRALAGGQGVFQGLGPLPEQVDGHLLGELLGVAGAENVRRVPDEHEDAQAQVIVDEGVRGESRRAADRALLACQGVGLGVGQPLRADRVMALEAALRVQPVEPEEGEDDLLCVRVDLRHGEVHELAELVGGQAGLGLDPEFLQVIAKHLLSRTELGAALAVGPSPLAVALGLGERGREQVAAVLDDPTERVIALQQFVLIDPLESLGQSRILSVREPLLRTCTDRYGEVQPDHDDPDTNPR